METYTTGRWKGHPMPTELTCAICSEKFSVRNARAKTAKYCGYKCHQIGEGRKGGAVTGERIKLSSAGKAYTKTNGRHTHRVVAEKITGRPLAKGEVVHHKDGNKLNNDPDNIEILPSQAVHASIHSKGLWRKKKNGK
jgi:hypothetical protein